MPIKHTFFSPKPDTSDLTKVQPSHWNDNHEFSEPSEPLQIFRRTNDSSVTEYEFAYQSDQIKISTDYNFTAILSETTSLVGGIANTVTFNKLPLGVKGSNQHHYLRVVDAIGGNEVIKLIGGSGNTLTFVPALNHTAGNWFITSATSGIFEALMSLGTQWGKIYIPGGSYQIYAPITYIALEDYNRVTFEGAGPSNTRLMIDSNINTNYSGIFVSDGPHISLAPIYKHFSVEAIQPWGTGIANYKHYPPFFFTQNCARGIIDDVIISGAWEGIHIESIAMVSDSSGWSIFNSIIAGYSAGLNVLNNYDSIRVDNCHFWPWVPKYNYTGDEQFDILDKSCTAIKIRRTDDMKISNCLFYYGTALDIATGFQGGGTVTIDNCMFDGFSICKISDTLVSFDNCNFILNETLGIFNAPGPSITWTSGILNISSCVFTHHTKNYSALKLAGNTTSSNSMVRVEGCHFHSDSTDINSTSVIEIDFAFPTSGDGLSVQIIGNAFLRIPNLPFNKALINVVNGDYVRVVIVGNTTAASVAGSKIFVSIPDDNFHIVTNNNLVGYSIAYPTADRIVGVYQDGANTLQPQSTVYYGGAGPKFTEGLTNSLSGIGTLVAGQVTINCTAIISGSRIFVTPTSAPLGQLYIAGKTVGTSFIVRSTNAGDVATFSWVIFNNV